MSPADITSLTYLNFELEIGPGEGRAYPVAVLRSPAGEARTVMQFPFDDLVLQNHLQALQIALLKSGGSRRRVPSPEERTVQTFGRALFDALLTDDVRSLYYESQRLAEQKGQGLRVQLRIEAPELAALPWEFLVDPRQEEYVCLQRHTPLVRYLSGPQPPRPLPVTPPLRILGMVADPSDLPRLQVTHEQHRVELALKSLRSRGLVELTWLDGQTGRDLQRAMRGGPWHVFHFIGHGGFDKNSDEGLLILSDEDGTSSPLPATQLGRLLANHRSLRLTLLNACQGAQGSSRDIFASTAATLARRGMPAVIAMQYEITDQAALEFARAFYESLADGLPVDAAVSEGRLAISLAVTHSVEWGTPVLMLRAPDGMLFDLPAALEASHAHEVAEPPVETPEPAPVTGTILTTKQKMALITALLQCEALANRQLREAVVDDLPGAVKQSIRRSDQDRADVNAIVSASLNYPDGLASLIEVVRFFEEDSFGMRAVDEVLVDAGLVSLVPAKTAAPVTEKTSTPATASRAESPPVTVPTSPRRTPTAEVKPAPILRPPATPIAFDWVQIPAGEFLMGSDPRKDKQAYESEKPQHRLTLPTFRITRVPVTVAQFAAFVEATGHKMSGSVDVKNKANHPVVNVSWHDTQAFCRWAGVQLPSEAEWEKAARGADGRIYPWGDSLPDKNRCNFDMNVNDTTPVGQYPAGVSPYGLHDMSGNVWEWTRSSWSDGKKDFAHPYDSSDGREKLGTDAPRVLRGGSWYGPAGHARCAGRRAFDPWVWDGGVGFRLVAP
jgi:formylglycine-generating enzyme required for sulfatase activity